MKRPLSALFGLGLMLSPAGELFARDNPVRERAPQRATAAPAATTELANTHVECGMSCLLVNNVS